MQNLVDGARPGDRFIFYCEYLLFENSFAPRVYLFGSDNGHGTQRESENQDEEDGFDEGTHSDLLGLEYNFTNS